MKWAHGDVCCPECGSTNVGRIRSRALYQCREKECRKQFSVKVGTIFQDSAIPLDKWLVGVWMIANCKNGVSSCELARAIGVKQQSAWHLLHRVRAAMKPPGHRARLSGEVESDTTFVGGRGEFMHKEKRFKRFNTKQGLKGKTPVHAVVQRKGEIRAMVIRKENKSSVHNVLSQHVEPGSNLYTDNSRAYFGLADKYHHEWVNHYETYVKGLCHTNTLEGFFALLRRSLKGTYVAVLPLHLEAYVDEQAYRYNYREASDWQRFDRLMHRIVGRQLTYSKLTRGKKR